MLERPPTYLIQD
jgi:hypothetical protein